MLDCFLSCFSVLVRVGTSLTRSSPLLGFLKLVVARIEGARRKKFYRRSHNKWYQSIAGSSWDRVSIPRAFVAAWWRSGIDLGAVLGLFVRSCVDLKIAFGLLEESNLEE